MPDWLRWLLDPTPFSPRSACSGLSPGLVAVFAFSDAAIFASYVALSVNFAWLIRRRHDRSLGAIFWFLGLFVFLCGATHAFGVLVLWVPTYRLGATINVATAAVSLAAAFLTAWWTPRILKIPRTRELYEQSMKLRRTVRELLHEIATLGDDSPEDAKARLEAMAERLRSV